MKEQLANQLAVIYIEPFGRGNKTTKIVSPCFYRGGEKKIHMQARQLARIVAELSRLRREPGLPLRSEEVVPDIGRISDVQGRAVSLRQLQRAVVALEHLRTLREPGGGQVCTGPHRSERIEIGANQFRVRKCPPGSHEEATRSDARIDDSRWHPRLLLRPVDHRCYDRRWSIDGAPVSALKDRSQRAIRVAKRIVTVENGLPQPRSRSTIQPPCVRKSIRLSAR